MHYSMLGLGDVVMPGLLLCFILRFDSLRNRSQNLFRTTRCSSRSKGSHSSSSGDTSNMIEQPRCLSTVRCLSVCSAITCFQTALFGYTIGETSNSFSVLPLTVTKKLIVLD